MIDNSNPENVDAVHLAQMLEVFVSEAEERLAAMEEGLLRLETRPDDADAVDLVFRCAHTLKGNAGSFGFGAVVTISHAVEDVFDQLRSGRIQATSALVTLLLQCVDALRGLMARGSGDELTQAHRSLLQRLTAMRSPGAGAGPTMSAPAEADASLASPPPAAARTLRVDAERLDQLLTLTGEIAIARARLSQMLSSPNMPRARLQEAQRESERLYIDLQDQVMKLRMVPIGPALQQLTRTVRDVAQALGREARLEFAGGDVEIDNSVLQLLRDPLTHMVRNSLDHGIEPPDVRERNGKPRAGLISLRCIRETRDILIELADDGAGIDRERVIARARERGLIGEDTVPLDPQLFSFLFEPGFSTTQTVSDISGRGVGLDVVRRNIHALRGSVSIASQAGRGTTLAIRLPLTLAIIEGLLVRVGETTFVLPMEDMRESRPMPAEEAARAEDRGVVNIRAEPLPYVRLRRVFRLQGPAPAREVLVVVAGPGGAIGLVVDAVSGERQIVMKPLSKVFHGVRGVAATTVLADGQVALILDVGALLETGGLRQQGASGIGAA